MSRPSRKATKVPQIGCSHINKSPGWTNTLWNARVPNIWVRSHSRDVYQAVFLQKVFSVACPFVQTSTTEVSTLHDLSTRETDHCLRATSQLHRPCIIFRISMLRCGVCVCPLVFASFTRVKRTCSNVAGVGSRLLP